MVVREIVGSLGDDDAGTDLEIEGQDVFVQIRRPAVRDFERMAKRGLEPLRAG